jgi:methyl-accepting chemotaxis protein
VNRLAARLRLAAGPLSRQFVLVMAIGVAPVLVALVVVSLLMILSDHEAVFVAAIVVGAGLLAGLATRLVANGILRDVGSIRDGLAAVARGEREARIATEGRDELSELAAAANAMIAGQPGGGARPVGFRPSRPGGGGLPRSAHADHVTAPARRGGRRRHRRR